MSRLSSIVTASEPNRIVETARRARLHADVARPVVVVAGVGVTSSSDRVAAGAERVVDVDIAHPHLRYQPA